ncbi:Lrp/AsnC family transcriptional regulator, partial [Burkholderia multivorans]|uniref:Lrp/AsnC family transcriptional regulator n=1 Tax=Burkholderia multivorans TaxID=87883 RepID=UPI001C66257A
TKEIPATFDLDDIDRSIVAALVENSRLSVRQLAERVHISRSAAHKRFTALIESGAIKGFTAEVDRSALGMTVTAVVVVRIGDRPWPEVRDDLAALPFVEKVQAVSGDIDALVTVNAPDNTALSQVILRRIHEVPGVTSSRSLLILDEADGHRPGAQG